MTETSLWLRWDDAQDNVGIDRYRVLQDGLEVAFAPKSEPYIFLEGLRANTTYNFVVFAQDIAGLESEPVSASFQPIDETPPTWSSASALIPINVMGDTVFLSWWSE